MLRCKGERDRVGFDSKLLLKGGLGLDWVGDVITVWKRNEDPKALAMTMEFLWHDGLWNGCSASMVLLP